MNLECSYGQYQSCRGRPDVAPSFKSKTRYTLYVSPESQISHIAINKGNIKRQCSIYNVLSIKIITLDTNSRKTTLIFG